MPMMVREEKKEYHQFIHRCGEVIVAIVKGSAIVGYTDVSKNQNIVVCPHCLKDIEYEDLQLEQNVADLGWPI